MTLTTLQQQPVHALPEDAALLRIVTEDARVGLVIVARDRTYLYANQPYAEILGLPSKNIVGMRVQEVLPEVYEDQIRARLDRAFAGERVQHEFAKGGDQERHYSVHYEPTLRDGSVAFVVVVITDVTERAQNQADLERFAAIVESSDDSIVSVDLQGVITSWNEGAEKIFGYRSEEMVGTSVFRLIPPDRQDEEAEIIAKIRRNERVRHLETTRLTKAGELITVSVTTSPIKDSHGQIVGASKLSRDITERKGADEERRFQQTMLMTERELSLDGILVVDPESKVLSYNGRFAQMWGLSDQTFDAKTDAAMLEAVAHQLRHPQLFAERVRQLYDQHDATSHEEIELNDGRIFERYSAPMRADRERYYGRVWYFRDVTERKQAEKALRFERDRAQRYLDAAEVILLALDPAGRVTLINRKGCELLGRNEHELIGCKWIDVCLPARVREALEDNFERLIAGDLSIVESPILSKGGEEKLIEWRNRVLYDDTGKVTGTLSSGTDVTARHALEAQYHQAQKMEALGRLAGGVAHDFNNLLSAILGYSQLLMDDLDPTDPHLIELGEIYNAGLRAARLTRQLLAFSRKEIIQPTVLDINVVTSSVRDMLERLIGEDVKVVMKLQPDLAAVVADRGQIEQILMNLAVNARDAMPRGGTLTIDTADVELDEEYAGSHFDLKLKPGSYVRLTVSDTGTGMSKEVQARLFEPFFTTKEVGKGTGLGLATVHGVIARIGGSIRVYSELDHGTSIAVYFPQASPGSVLDAVRPVARSRAAGETVLVVEDAEGLRELARRMLSAQGYLVVLAGSASEALERFDQEPSIDVILTDVVMPGGSGPDLMKQLVELRPGLKVVYMSGYTEEAISHHGVLDPDVTFLHKPFTAESLGSKIREALDH